MKSIYISDEVKDLWPEITLACIEGEVKVGKSSQELNLEINQYCEKMRKDMVVADIAKERNIQNTRKAYRKLGKDPTRYRSSAEALARRILKGQDLYGINNIVEINNLISLKSLWPVCAYDLSNLKGGISLERAEKHSTFEAIGRGKLNIEFLPVFNDDIGYFGSTTSDSKRAMITRDTKELLMIIVSFNRVEGLDIYLEELESLLEKYASGKKLKKTIINS